MNNDGASSGIGLAGAVFIVFLVLKLAKIGEVANWSWWWVTAPLWMTTALCLFVALVAVLVGVVIAVVKE